MTSAPVDRPRLLPHAVPLVRGSATVQLGLWPGDAVVLDGLSTGEVAFVTRLDGTRDRGQVLRDADVERGEALLRVLDDAGLLARASGGTGRRTDPPRTPIVRVHGAGRLADDIALQLSGHGVARVVRDDGTSGGSGRGAPERGAAGQSAAGQGAGGQGDGPALVIVVEHRAVGPDVRAEVEGLGAPVLPVVHDGPHGVVGPLVVPGRSACLRCLDLTRADQDPAWAALLWQATTSSVRPDLAQTDPDRELAAFLAATAVMVAGCAIRGQCPPGVSLEASLPWPRAVQRRWTPHPSCGCV